MKNKENGFTLIEVLVAVMITGLLIISFTRGLYTSRKCNSLTRDYYLAVNWTGSLIEVIKGTLETPDEGTYRPKEILNPLQMKELEAHIPVDLRSDTLIRIRKANFSEQSMENNLYLIQIICRWEAGNEVKKYILQTYKVSHG